MWIKRVEQFFALDISSDSKISSTYCQILILFNEITNERDETKLDLSIKKSFFFSKVIPS